MRLFQIPLFASLVLAAGLSSVSAVASNSGLDLSAIDTAVRPQDDFFRYANGTWLKNTEIPADKSRYGSFIILYDKSQQDVRAIVDELAAKKDLSGDDKKVADYYASFMDEDRINTAGLKPLANKLAAIDAIETHAQLAAAFGNKSAGPAPFGFYINQDRKDSTRYVVYLTQSGLGLPDRDYYLVENEKFAQIRSQYQKHLETVLALMGSDAPAADAKAVYVLESDLAKIQWSRVDNRDAVKTYNRYKDLTKLASKFNWDAYLSASEIAGKGPFIVRQPSYMEQLDTLIHSTPLGTWRTYLKWQLVNSYSPLLSAPFADARFEFYGKALSGRQQQQPRWKRAIRSTNGVLGEAIGRAYVDRHFKPEAKQRMLALVDNLIAAYRESITELDWMSKKTRQQALKKLDRFVAKIGYPEIWKDYSQLTIRADDLVGNQIRYQTWSHDREVAKLGKPIDRQEWFMTPQTINAYYNPLMNEIVFPAAILQPPFFDMTADDAVNYGAIGAVIGHEIGHGFDDQGSRYDGDGNLNNWWTESDRKGFETRTRQLIEQFSQYEVLPGLHINGELTQGENIGDLGGLSIAHKAYLRSLAGKHAPVVDGFTGDQRFFLGWAQVWRDKMRDQSLRNQITTDPHSPAEFRVQGIVSNLPAFFEAFDVQPGDKLYRPPEQRVKIW